MVTLWIYGTTVNSLEVLIHTGTCATDDDAQRTVNRVYETLNGCKKNLSGTVIGNKLVFPDQFTHFEAAIKQRQDA